MTGARCRVAFLVLAVAFGILCPEGTGADEETRPRRGVTNLQALDPTTSLVEVRRFMLSFNAALGTRCRDCHDLSDYASDAKPLKVVAREMIRMQAGINERHFSDRGELVTCWTCHRGERIPATTLSKTDSSAVLSRRSR